MKQRTLSKRLLLIHSKKTLVKAVTDSLDSYGLKKNIENKMAEQVSKVVVDLGFQSYNSFMIEKMAQIINETCREDICQKAEKKFKDLFLCQTKEIRLSSIFEKYREIASNNVEEAEKYERMNDGWYYKFEVDGSFIRCELDYEEREHRYIGIVK